MNLDLPNIDSGHRNSHDISDLNESRSRAQEIKQNILITGRMGNGLRSLGNSLLEEYKFFTDIYNDDSYEMYTKEDSCKRITIYPLTDNNLLTTEQEHQEKIKEALQNYQVSNGFDAIIFVLKYGVRFTQQEKDAVEKIKKIFGKNVFNENIIIAFTHGDTFDNMGQHEEMNANKSFIRWCQLQKGDIKNMFTEVKYRCVLFNNKCEHEEAKRLQADHLFRLITIQEKNSPSNNAYETTSTPKLEVVKVHVQEKHENFIKNAHTDNDKESKSGDGASKNKVITIKRKYTVTDLENARSKPKPPKNCFFHIFCK